MIPIPCPKGDEGCGQEHPGCSKHNAAGKACGAPPMRGTDPRRCRTHLGTSPAAFVAARDVEKVARKLAGLSEFQPVNVEDVLSEHLALAGEVLHWRDTLRDMVSELTHVGYASSKTGEQTKAAVKLYAEALDRADRVLTNIARLGIDERMAAISEQQTERLRAVLAVALRALGLTFTEQRVAEAVQSGIAQTRSRALERT